MKKKIITIIICIISFISMFGLFACDNQNDDNGNKEIVLTIDNYSYYLTITTQYTGGGSAAGGSYRYSTYDVFISGTLSGIYQNCVLHLQSGASIQLNVSGNAQTKKRITNGVDNFVVVEVEGKIILY